MHDLALLRNDPELIVNRLVRRGIDPLEVREASRAALRLNRAVGDVQALQQLRNDNAAEVGRAKRADEPIDDLVHRGNQLGIEISETERFIREQEADLRATVAEWPNCLADDVFDGVDESHNVLVSLFGNPVDRDREHFDIGAPLGLDAAAGAKLSGARYTVLRSGIARLSRALGQYMLDQHVLNGYTEINPPVIVREDALWGTGQFPKFRDDVFEAGEGYLAPTSEVMLTNLYRNELVDLADLPIRMTALTQCFRAEAGSAGRDTRGLIRQHQFEKVELVSITARDQASDEHERMTARAESILKGLGLPFRRMLLCSGDTGFSARKTYDIEVWMAGARTYREISSCSDCGDFQARRLNLRVRSGKQKSFAATLNGSGVAVGRALAAVLEWYTDGDGVVVPPCLIPYMGGQLRIDP